MNIIVLNGSPKGDVSVTMQYVHYIQKKFPQHGLKIINISQAINKIEKDQSAFDGIVREIQESDGVLWAFPLYVFAVASQYKRFIELIFERNAAAAFKGKYAAAIATSVKVSDHTAINYINAICDDLGMKYVDSFSPHMDDLQNEDVRNNLLKFAQNFFDTITEKQHTLKTYRPISWQPIRYQYQTSFEKLDTAAKKIIVVTDSLESQNLSEMIRAFRNSFEQDIELVNLQDIDIKGGCLGCIRCGYNYECAYTGKDGFIDFYNDKILASDVIILAGTIKDRYLSSLWKRYFDRSFYKTHTPVLAGKQVGFLVSGPLGQIPNLRQIMESYFQYQYANLVGFATDEFKNSQEIDDEIYALAGRLIQLSKQEFKKPKTSLGVGLWKVLRDEIYGDLRFPFVADYRAYEKLHVFDDFPQDNLKENEHNEAMMNLIRDERVRHDIYHNQLKNNMILELKKIVDDPNL
jgi:multimeric flavodoxin WrbA